MKCLITIDGINSMRDDRRTDNKTVKAVTSSHFETDGIDDAPKGVLSKQTIHYHLRKERVVNGE